MDFYRVIRNIDSELKKPLPGQEVQLRMSSMQRIRELINESQKKME